MLCKFLLRLMGYVLMYGLFSSLQRPDRFCTDIFSKQSPVLQSCRPEETAVAPVLVDRRRYEGTVQKGCVVESRGSVKFTQFDGFHFTELSAAKNTPPTVSHSHTKQFTVL